jgi:hypothetical protein
MTELIMKKIATLALALSLTASAALAGGYSAPVVAAEPVVVAPSPSSNMGLLPLLLLIGLIAVASSNSSEPNNSAP